MYIGTKAICSTIELSDSSKKDLKIQIKQIKLVKYKNKQSDYQERKCDE